MIWQDFIHQFLERFIGKPEDLYPTWSLEEIIRSESTHFLFSCFMGWLVLSLTWTILSSRKRKWPDRYIFHTSLLFGFLASVTMHIFIDGFTNIA